MPVLFKPQVVYLDSLLPWGSCGVVGSMFHWGLTGGASTQSQNSNYFPDHRLLGVRACMRVCGCVICVLLNYSDVRLLGFLLGGGGVTDGGLQRHILKGYNAPHSLTLFTWHQ